MLVTCFYGTGNGQKNKAPAEKFGSFRLRDRNGQVSVPSAQCPLPVPKACGPESLIDFGTRAPRAIYRFNLVGPGNNGP